jgi:PIN domain nuclease of toxin-antitoxin system
MRLLLDTHTFIWAATGDARLSAAALSRLADPQNERFLSTISVYEMAIKIQLRKLDLKRPSKEFVEQTVRRAHIVELPVRTTHSIAILNLPPIHKDPFDRLIVATAIEEDLHLVTSDDLLRKYPVKTIW